MKKVFLGYLEDFLNYLKNIKNYSAKTVITYQKPIEDAITLCEIYEEEDLTIFDIKKFRIKIASQSNKTINKKLSAIRSFVKYLEIKEIEIRLIGDNSVKSEQTLPKPIKTENIFESLEVGTDEEKLIVLLIYSFGLRISELAGLKIEDIKDEHITVLGKGNKYREIPSNDLINGLVKKYIDNYNPKEYIFEKKLKPYTVRQLQYAVEKIFKKIGIKASPHQLRHSFATDLLNSGARINDISELLGHSSLKATGIYTKLNTNTKLKQYNMSHPLNNM
jgi:integrase/recombinase XerC